MITFTKDHKPRTRYKITTLKKDGLKRIEWIDIQDVYIKLVGIESVDDDSVSCNSMFVYVQGRNEKENKKISIIKRSLPHLSKVDKNIPFNNNDRIYVHNGDFYRMNYHIFNPYVP